MAANFTFKLLQETDLELLCSWLDKPHVKEWWNDGLTHDVIKMKYRERIGSTTIAPFIICIDNKPIGFIQYYIANIMEIEWWPMD